MLLFCKINQVSDAVVVAVICDVVDCAFSKRKLFEECFRDHLVDMVDFIFSQFFWHCPTQDSPLPYLFPRCPFAERFFCCAALVRMNSLQGRRFCRRYMASKLRPANRFPKGKGCRILLTAQSAARFLHCFCPTCRSPCGGFGASPKCFAGGFFIRQIRCPSKNFCRFP